MVQVTESDRENGHCCIINPKKYSKKKATDASHSYLPQRYLLHIPEHSQSLTFIFFLQVSVLSANKWGTAVFVILFKELIEDRKGGIVCSTQLLEGKFYL